MQILLLNKFAVLGLILLKTDISYYSIQWGNTKAFVKLFFYFFYFTAVTFEIKCQICMGIKSLHDSLRSFLKEKYHFTLHTNETTTKKYFQS